MKKMDDVHKTQVVKISSAKLDMMKPTIKKMQSENADTIEQILKLETALQAPKLEAADVDKFAEALVENFDKLDISDFKMKK